jgi:hypothetical protein
MEFLNSQLPPMGKQWYTGPFPQPRSLTDTKPNLYIKKGDPQRLSPTVGFSELIPAIC